MATSSLFLKPRCSFENLPVKQCVVFTLPVADYIEKGGKDSRSGGNSGANVVFIIAGIDQEL